MRDLRAGHRLNGTAVKHSLPRRRPVGSLALGWRSIDRLLAVVLLLSPIATAAADREARPGLLVRLAIPAGRAPSAGTAGARATTASLASAVADLGATWEAAFPPFPAGLPARARGADPLRAEALRAELSAIAVARFADAGARDQAVARLRALPEVALVEPISPIVLDDDASSPVPDPARIPPPGSGLRSSGALPPTDEQYPEQWALPLIGMLSVWAEGAGTPGLLIAIVDTGIETSHPDLAPNLAVNSPEATGVAGVDDDANGYVDDVHGWNALEQNADIEDGFGHGTHVAGIVGAAADGRGTVGVTWDADLLPVRMFDDLGRGTNLAGAQAITYAADRGARVINMSWGTGRRSGAIQLAIDYAAATGAVLVASAGNAGEQVLDNFPAAYDAVISVGATAINDALASFSNHGVRIDVAAPGVNILSTEHGAYFSLSGTSQSAAFVTGIAAHLRYRYPELPAEEVRAILRQSAADLGRKGWDPFFGAGRVDAARALGDPRAPTAEIQTPLTQAATAAETIAITAAVEPPAGESGAVEYALDFGLTEDPATFEPWTAGTGRGVFHFPPLPLASRPEGDLILRLRVRDQSGHEAEDRVLIRIDRRPPALVRREVVNRLAGGRLDQWLRYQADEPVVGRVYVRPADSDEAPVMFGSLEAARDHTADLGSLLPGRYEYWIDIQDIAGFERRSAGGDEPFGREILPVIDVPASGFQLREKLSRVDLGAVADLDGDGRSEVLVEKTGPGGGSAVLGVQVPGGPLATRAVGGRGLPLAARDVDRDGVPEVLIADSGLTLYRGLFGSAPEVLWKDPLGDRRTGGQLTDVDGDGAVEVLFSTLAGAQLTMVEWNGAGFDPVAIEMTRSTLAAGFVVSDYDRDGRTEIVLGSLSGELVALESTPQGIVEVRREPFLGGLANAVTACPIGDGDGDGRSELAISAVGALLDRAEHPTVAILESPADNRYEVAAQYEFRDKNTPYDNALAAGDVDGDGVPEVLVAQAGDIYLLAADRENRYLPIWRAPRIPGGRAAMADLDGDGPAEILFTEQVQGAPVTSIYGFMPATAAEPALAWRPVLDPLGNEIQWQSPKAGVRVFDLALYRARVNVAGRVAPPYLESDLAGQRIFAQRGEVTTGSAFRDVGEVPGAIPYFLAYTLDNGKSRLRVLDGPRVAARAPGVPSLLVLDPFPNPAQGAVELGVALARSGPVTIRIVDLAGRVRRRLLADELPAGRSSLVWDGRDGDGHRVGRGVYFVAVSGLGEEAAARVALIGGGGP